MFDFAKLKRSIASLGDQRKKLDLEIEALKQQREELNALPRSREDLAEALDCWIVGQRGNFLETLKQNIGHMIQDPSATLDTSGRAAIFQRQTMVGDRMLRDGDLLGLLGPLVREQLKQAVLELPDYPEVTGPTWAERAKQIEALDQQIGQLEADSDKLKQQAAAAGISLEPEREVIAPDYLGGEPLEPVARQRAIDKVNQR